MARRSTRLGTHLLRIALAQTAPCKSQYGEIRSDFGVAGAVGGAGSASG
jgi:hypothetical protein